MPDRHIEWNPCGLPLSGSAGEHATGRSTHMRSAQSPLTAPHPTWPPPPTARASKGSGAKVPIPQPYHAWSTIELEEYARMRD